MSSTTLVGLTMRGSNAFDERSAEVAGSHITALSIHTVQANICLTCNLACHHCHVESSPSRAEQMDWQTMSLVLEAARKAGAARLDITGGAPETNADFRQFVDAALAQHLDVMVRTNLTIMLQDGYQDLPQWFADRRVHLIASMPCYLEVNVERQRGKHVYHESIEAIRRLNAAGYGSGSDLRLDLVYNPGGPSLPPDQKALEADYRREFDSRHGVRFTRLLTMTNMAIGRFLHDLQRQGRAERYAQLLRDAFNPATLDGLMCRHQLHVGWDGTLYDCDFNFALGLPGSLARPHISSFGTEAFLARKITTGEHCFGCTAGHGSSCGGSLT